MLSAGWQLADALSPGISRMDMDITGYFSLQSIPAFHEETTGTDNGDGLDVFQCWYSRCTDFLFLSPVLLLPGVIEVFEKLYSDQKRTDRLLTMYRAHNMTAIQGRPLPIPDLVGVGTGLSTGDVTGI